jgi:hypothetical protein
MLARCSEEALPDQPGRRPAHEEDLFQEQRDRYFGPPEDGGRRVRARPRSRLDLEAMRGEGAALEQGYHRQRCDANDVRVGRGGLAIGGWEGGYQGVLSGAGFSPE